MRSWRHPGSRRATGSFSDDHPRGPQDAVAEAVALLQHLHDRPGLEPVDGLREQSLVDVRIEGAVRLDLGHAGAREHVGERAVDQPDAVLQLRLLVFLCRDQRPLEVVEHGQELLDERLARTSRLRGPLALRPLAEVVELRLQPAQRIEVLGALAGELLDRSCWDRPLLGVCPYVWLELVLGHEVGASSSTTSASSITSSSEGSAPLPPPEDAACAAVACAYTASASLCEASWSASVFDRISAMSSPSSAVFNSMTRPSIVAASASSSDSRCSLRLFSVA